MARVIRLTVLTGPHKGQKFCLCGAARCLIGRSPACFVSLNRGGKALAISREHCELTLGPSDLTLKDLHSRNGTYLNGSKIDTAMIALTSDESVADTDNFTQCSLLSVPGTTLRIDVVECPPPDFRSGEHAVNWAPGENAKRSCPVDCV